MIGAVRWVALCALLSSAFPAAAFVRETTTPGHPESGVCLWWRDRQVTYRVNAETAALVNPPCGSAAVAAAAAAAGLATWGTATRAGQGSACTDFSFLHGGSTTQTALGNDGVNLVVFRTRMCSDIPCSGAPGACAAAHNCWEHEVGTIGLTTTSFDAETGELFDADMELFAWDGVPPPSGFGQYFTCEEPTTPRCTSDPRQNSPATACTWVDVGAVVTHEAGHMLGLDHVCSSRFVAPFNACPDPEAVMHPAVGDPAQRVLAQDDVEGICTIYPVGGPTLTCASPDKKSSGGCSSAGGGGLAGLLALTFVAWRERRRRR